MPNGGQIGSGSGLRLQATTPGVTDSGNANLDGVLIAGRLTTSTANIGNQAEFHGHNIKFNAGEPTNTVAFGNDINFSNAGSSLIAMGFQATCTSPGGMAIGSTVQAGAVPATGFANMIAVGKDVTVGGTAAAVGNSVGFGYQVNVGPSKGVGLGSSVSLNNANSATSASVAVGISISVGAAATRNVLFGNNISPVSINNILAIGDYQTGGYPVAGPGAIDNSILIGNDLQSIVKIGPYTITNGIAAVGSLQTSNVTIANTAVETTGIGALVGSNLIPAGRLQVGTTIRIRARGVIADTGATTLQIRIKVGANTFSDTGATALPALVGTHGWTLEADITVRKVGGPGSAIGNAFTYINVINSPDLDTTNTATTALDTTIANLVDMTFQWGAAAPGNTLTVTHFTMELLG